MNNTAENLSQNGRYDALKDHMKSEHDEDFLTVYIADEMFGIPVLQVQDVLGRQDVTTIPLSPPEILGSLNLRGRVVTAIDVRKALDIEPSDQRTKQMSVVVEFEGELYSLIIDRVGDVLTLSKEDFENNPATLDKVWKDVSVGVYRLKDRLMLILDVPKLLNSIQS